MCGTYIDTHNNMQCDRGRSLDIFLKEILSPESTTLLTVVGCGCSSATEPVAEIIHQWNISLVRHWCGCMHTAAVLTKHGKY